MAIRLACSTQMLAASHPLPEAGKFRLSAFQPPPRPTQVFQSMEPSAALASKDWRHDALIPSCIA